MLLCQTKQGERRFLDIEDLKLQLEMKLPDNVYYIYIITSNDVVTTRSHQYRHPVNVVSQEDLSHLMPNWGLYSDRLV